MQTYSDEELIALFKEGDTGAFNRLVGRWQEKLYSFAYRYLGNADDAMDICQNAFIRAYKNMKKLRDTARFSSWMYQITLNLCKDALKSRKKKRAASLDDEWRNEKGETVKTADLIQEGPAQETGLQGSEAAVLVQNALYGIPEDQRIVIIMKEYQGMKFKEIAEILKLPINTVKSRMYYGLKNIRDNLAALRVGKEELYNEG